MSSNIPFIKQGIPLHKFETNFTHLLIQQRNIPMMTAPSFSGFDEQRLERVTDYISRNYIDTGIIPGCQLGISRHGHLAYFKNFGYMDLERGSKTTDDTIYRIYSMSKPITAVALMILHERGAFQLDDPVHKYVPTWKSQRVWVSGSGDDMVTEDLDRPVTIRDLLRHTSGLLSGESPHLLDDIYRDRGIRDFDNPDSLQLFMDKLAKVPLRYQPGQNWMYSLATDACGALVEIISGKTFSQFLTNEIFDPLGMSDTSFVVKPEQAFRFAANYAVGPDGGLELSDDPVASEFRNPGRFQCGGGGLVGTTSDFVRFCEMLRRGGELDGVRILGSRTITAMTTNQLPGGRDLEHTAIGLFGGAAGRGIGHGLGFGVRMRQPEIGWLGNGEFFWGGAASTSFLIDPREDLLIIFMTQLMPPHPYVFAAGIRNIVYSSIID
jgi:CubicO group peptidase (beta-lactamase class C family)